MGCPAPSVAGAPAPGMVRDSLPPLPWECFSAEPSLRDQQDPNPTSSMTKHHEWQICTRPRDTEMHHRGPVPREEDGKEIPLDYRR